MFNPCCSGNGGDDVFVMIVRGAERAVVASVAEDFNAVGDGAHVGEGVADEDHAHPHVPQGLNVAEHFGGLRHR